MYPKVRWPDYPRRHLPHPGAANKSDAIARDVVGIVRHRTPRMPIATDLSIAINVIQQHELLCQLMMIGRHIAREHAQTRITIAFRVRTSRQVSEYLVVVRFSLIT